MCVGFSSNHVGAAAATITVRDRYLTGESIRANCARSYYGDVRVFGY